MSAAGGLSRRAFAAQVGATVTVIQRLVERGVLPLDEGGKIRMPESLRAYFAVRPPQPAGVPPASDEGSAPESSAVRPTPANRHTEVIQVELESKRLGVRLRELKLGRETGELVPRDVVAADARATCTAIRSALLALPARVALLVEALVASSDALLRAGRIQRLLEDEVNLALEALHGHEGASPAAPAAKGQAT